MCHIFPTLGVLPDNQITQSPCCLPCGGRRLGATGMCNWLPVTLTLSPFPQYIHGLWFQHKSQCLIHFLPVLIFSCDMAMFRDRGKREEEKSLFCGQSRYLQLVSFKVLVLAHIFMDFFHVHATLCLCIYLEQKLDTRMKPNKCFSHHP